MWGLVERRDPQTRHALLWRIECPKRAPNVRGAVSQAGAEAQIDAPVGDFSIQTLAPLYERCGRAVSGAYLRGKVSDRCRHAPCADLQDAGNRREQGQANKPPQSFTNRSLARRRVPIALAAACGLSIVKMKRGQVGPEPCGFDLRGEPRRSVFSGQIEARDMEVAGVDHNSELCGRALYGMNHFRKLLDGLTELAPFGPILQQYPGSRLKPLEHR